MQDWELLHPDLYGSLPSASRPELPVLEPIETESIAPIRLVPFHEAYAHKDYGCVVHFFIRDHHFLSATENGRRWQTVHVLKDGTKVIELKKKGAVKLPEESHSPNSTYAIFNKDGSGVKAISKYGADGKKIWEIHTTDHKGLGPHYHKWKDRKPLDEEPHPLTPAMKKLLKNVSDLN